MISIELPSLLNLLVGSVAIYAIYYIHWQFTVGANRRRLIREHGCKPIKLHPGLNSPLERLLGISTFRAIRKASKEDKLLELSYERFQRYGNTLTISVLGTPVYMTVEPENVKTVLATNFDDWNLTDRRKRSFMPLLGRGIFTTDGVAWRHSRELLRPNFVRSQVGDLATFEVHVTHLIKNIPRDGSTVNLQDLFFRLTIDSATEFLFGESVNCLAPGAAEDDGAKFAEAWNRSQEDVGETSRNGPVALLFRRSTFGQDIKYVHEFADKYVRRGLELRNTYDVEKADPKHSERYVFLNELVKQTRDPVQIRSELLNVLLAGRDTTASLLSNVWFMLARRPDIWEKLQTEVNELGDARPTFEQLKAMKYLKAVLNESLRLHPLVPVNARMAVVDTVLPLGGGEDGKSPLLIPAKSVLNYNSYTTHRRKDIFGEDAEEFKPERWEKLRPGWEYLPFNGGPRICIGQQFALTEASFTTVRLMQEFKKIESRDDSAWQEWLTLTCVGRNGAKVGLMPA